MTEVIWTDLPEWLWDKMTEEDQMEWTRLYLSGNMSYHPDGSVTIMAGKWKFDKMKEMRQVLIDKYK